MPIFEYRCVRCGAEFEKLMRSGATAECPSCHGRKLSKKISVFATTTPGASSASLPEPCAGCGNPGGPGCALN